MDDLYDKIERYLQQDLKGDELEAFERQLRTDPDLATEVQLLKDVKNGIAGKIRFEETKTDWNANLEKLGSEFFDQPPATAKTIPIWRRPVVAVIAMAAAVALLLMLWQPWQPSLYDRYARHPVLALSERSAGNALDMVTMENAFNTRQYEQAASLLENYLITDPDDPEIRLFLGISYLELEQFDRALPVFTALHEGNSAFKDLGTWYLALTHLRQGQRQEATGYLQQIPPASDQYPRAQDLLRDLE